MIFQNDQTQNSYHAQALSRSSQQERTTGFAFRSAVGSTCSTISTISSTDWDGNGEGALRTGRRGKLEAGGAGGQEAFKQQPPMTSSRKC